MNGEPVINPLNDPAMASDPADFVRRAERVPGAGLLEVEFNFPAGILQVLDGPGSLQDSDAPALRRYAELGMLQLALVNAGHAPGTPWIIKAHAAGWRYRIDKGFYAEAPAFSLEEPSA